MTITKIPAKHELPIHVMSAPERRKTAGYARVSTNEEEQQSSYEAQVEYYTKMIQGNPKWEFVDVYTDDGISATSTKKRDGFDDELWYITVDKVLVHADGRLSIVFRDGAAVVMPLEK